MNKGSDANFTSLDSSDLYGDVFSNTDPITEVVTSNEVIKDPDYSSVDDAFSPKQDVILEVLKAKNVDPNSIKFENENGEIEERTWSELSFEEQKNIIVSNDLDVDYGLEEDEINIINDFRESKLSYQDYLQNIKKASYRRIFTRIQSLSSVYNWWLYWWWIVFTRSKKQNARFYRWRINFSSWNWKKLTKVYLVKKLQV